jgi:hypothetical protein
MQFFYQSHASATPCESHEWCAAGSSVLRSGGITETPSLRVR